MKRLSCSLSFVRSYATRGKRPKPGTSERPAYHPPDPLINNPQAVVTPLQDESLTFIHRPPPTAPSPYSLTTAPSSPLLLPASLSNTVLPPFVRLSANKIPPERVSDATVAEIRRLRRDDPIKYSRGALAKMFGCTQNFVGTIAALKSSTRMNIIRTRNLEHEKVREKWSEKKATVRAIRAKRREFW